MKTSRRKSYFDDQGGKVSAVFPQQSFREGWGTRGSGRSEDSEGRGPEGPSLIFLLPPFLRTTDVAEQLLWAVAGRALSGVGLPVLC